MKDTEITSNISLSKKGKKTDDVPKGAIIESTSDPKVIIEEIENGYIITKEWEIKYKTDKKQSYCDYCYKCKKWYSKEDPLTINLKGGKDSDLADAFNEDEN